MSDFEFIGKPKVTEGFFEKNKDLILIILCIIFVVGIIIYIYLAEMYKINFANICLKDISRICSCG